jgi:hypothetical protein
VDACSNSYVAKWLFHKHLKQTQSLWMQNGKLGCPSICFGAQGNKITVLWMFVFWATHAQDKSRMGRGPLIEWKKSGIIMGWISSPSITNGTC